MNFDNHIPGARHDEPIASVMTRPQAEALAQQDRDWIARPLPNTRFIYWGVWSSASDHWVEFDHETIAKAETTR